MQNLINEALNTGLTKGAEYIDIRFEDLTIEDIALKNGELEYVNYSESKGFGVRVLYKGFWGFASSSIINLDEINNVVTRAIKIAEASSHIKAQKVILSPVKSVKDKYISPFKIDPFKISIEKKLELLNKVNNVISTYEKIKHSEITMSFFKHKKVFGSSENSYIEQEFIKSGAGMQVWAIDDNDIQVRSYPANSGGDFSCQGYEFIESMKLEENADKICQEAIKLLTAEQCPSLVTTVIIDSNQMANQIHESVGHPTEFDRVLGTEASFAGTSFLTIDKLKKLKFGSEIVNLVSDPTIYNGLGGYAYDDEGVKTRKTSLVKNGIFSGYLTSRETAHLLDQESSASMKAANWNYLPLIRMPNINLEPGDWKLENLFSDTDDGIYLCTNKSWSIDDKRWNFQFSTEIAWEIKNGELGKIYKNPTYTDNTVHFWNSCDAVCNEDSWHIWGIPNCGKGQPLQTGHVGHGSSPARFRNIRIGVLE